MYLFVYPVMPEHLFKINYHAATFKQRFGGYTEVTYFC